jgi:hypothetical protein
MASLLPASPIFLLLLLLSSKSSFHSVHAHTAERAEPLKPAALESLLGDSEAIRFLGSARRVRLLNDPHPVAAIDYFSTAFLHCINVFAASTCMTTSNRPAHD